MEGWINCKNYKEPQRKIWIDQFQFQFKLGSEALGNKIIINPGFALITEWATQLRCRTQKLWHSIPDLCIGHPSELLFYVSKTHALLTLASFNHSLNLIQKGGILLISFPSLKSYLLVFVNQSFLLSVYQKSSEILHQEETFSVYLTI